MRAIQIKHFGDLDQFIEVTLPDPAPKKGEVCIDIRASGFNPVDYKIRRGYLGGTAPLILGADCSGVISAVGPGVTEFEVGDEVMAFIFGQGSNGTYADKVAISTSFVTHKPRTLPFEDAASVPLVALTAYRMIFTSDAIKRGHPIFFTGASGGVGPYAIQMAQIAGAGPIYALAGGPHSIDFLVNYLHMKKDHLLLYPNLSIEEMRDHLIQMNHGKLFTTTFDLVGGEIKKLCLSLTEFHGHMVTIVPEAPEFHLSTWDAPASIAFQKNLSLHFIFVGAQSFNGSHHSWESYHSHLAHIKEMIDEGKLRVPKAEVVGSFSIETIKKAHTLLEEGHVKGKLVQVHHRT